VLLTSRPGLQGSPNLVLQYGNFTEQNPVVKFVPAPSIQTLASLPTDVSDPNLLIMASVAARLRHQDELDRLVGAATRQRDGYDLMGELQRFQVAAGVCQTAQDRYEIDPQLRHLE